jgi:hypothetical protein
MFIDGTIEQLISIKFSSDYTFDQFKRMMKRYLMLFRYAGIWIVIVGCIAEYLLLLTYIGVAAYDFFKNRKMMKKMNVQRRTYAFLKFDESHRDVGNRWHDAARSEQSRSSAAQSRSWPERMQPAHSSDAAGRQRPGNAARPGSRSVEKRQDNPATNNPQLLKFDGESAPPPVDNIARRRKVFAEKNAHMNNERKE